MSIRAFVALLLVGVFTVTVGIIVLSGLFLKNQLLPLFAGDMAAVMQLIIETSVASFLLSVGLLIILFLAIGRYVAKPIRTITRTMQAFAETGETPPAPTKAWMPKELRTLNEVFIGFTEKVALVHKHDLEISRVKSDFISTAAHQLRTPLTGIRWALEALQMEQLTDTQKQILASAVEKSHQLVAVVGTLLDISSIESGKYKYAFVVGPLDKLVDEVSRDFQPLALKSNVSLLFEKSGAGSAIVRMDVERIRWVLNNLIENAIRYTPAGGSVRVTTELAPGRAFVKVRDTGIGIAIEDKGNIFERFYRAPNAIAKENGGNGLGLYIARTVATDHGGDLNFESNPTGPGTLFTLSLPIASTPA
ncbi:MAG: HAMP domain-containing sensor histidine kinase [Patescibacteria group bacterium]